MENEIVFIKLNDWLKDFYNLPEELPLFKNDWQRIKESNLAYDFEAAYQAGKEWLKQEGEKDENLKNSVEKFLKKWPLMIHLNELMNKEDLAKAQETLLALKKIDENDPSVYFHLGYIQKRLGLIEKSIENYQKCIELYPDFLAAYTNLARTYTEIGNREKAVELLKKALEIQPGDVYILEELVNLKEFFPVYTDPDNYESLVYVERESYQKTIEKEIENSNNPDNLFNLANILVTDQLYETALKAIEKFLSLSQDKNQKLTALLLKADVLRKMGKLKKSWRQLAEIEENYLELPPDYYFVKAKLEIQEEKITDALNSLSKLLEENPDHLEGINLYYFILRELNREEEIKEELENLASDFPDSWAPLYQLGIHYALNNDFQQAEKYFWKALENNPEAETILFDLSGIYAQKGLHNEIINFLEPYFLKDMLKNPSILWNLANAYKITGQIAKAQKVFEKILSLKGISPIYIQNAKNELNQLKEFKSR